MSLCIQLSLYEAVKWKAEFIKAVVFCQKKCQLLEWNISFQTLSVLAKLYIKVQNPAQET